ncbi:MAG: hypothetical protein M3332_08785 [Actinomycetota bacterium]|nr:hypothetical protein [Actinomycetota bacterium]
MTPTVDTVAAQISAPIPALADLITDSLSVTHLVDGHFVRMEATVHGDCITLDITRIEFHTDTDTTVRVFLQPSVPITTAPGAAEPRFEIATRHEHPQARAMV